jgi:hypothetical protein
MLLKNVVLYEIYSKTLQWPDTFGTSLYNVRNNTAHEITITLYTRNASQRVKISINEINLVNYDDKISSCSPS